MKKIPYPPFGTNQRLYKALRGRLLSRGLFLAVCLVLLTAVFFPAGAFAQTGEYVVSFDGQAEIRSDRTAVITEQIEYDFGDNARHGIYRDIPTKYQKNGASYNLKLSHVAVSMDHQPVKFNIRSTYPVFNIRIGDADTTITGVHTYTITYETDRAIRFFSDGHAEFYWNVTGNDWAVPVLSSSFAVVGPSGYAPTATDAVCYTGSAGSTDRACALQVAGNRIVFRTEKPLSASEGLTIDASFPNGVIKAPSPSELIWQIVSDNWILGLPVATLIVMFLLWRKFGKDPKGRGTIIPQYEPPQEMSPMEMDALWQEKRRHQAVTATIIDLARRGYMTISYGDTEDFKAESVVFTAKKPIDDSLKPFEVEIYNGLFEDESTATFETVRDSFSKYIALATTKVFYSLQSKEFIVRNPIATRAAYSAGAFIVAFILLQIFARDGVLPIVSIILSGIIALVFGWLMPRKTEKGARVLEEIKGFKWFLSVTEKDRLAFTDAPKLKPETFHEFLPYAIVFGVENEWAKQFAGMQVPPPDYVSGISTWNTFAFVHAMHTLDTRAAAGAYIPPRQGGGSGFGGGGFSGGGFGGGGGGSW